MGFTAKSTRINRATTESVRFYPLALASRAAALARSFGAFVAELWREIAPGASARSSGGTAMETERTASAAAQSSSVGAHVGELQREIAPAASSLAIGASSAELQRISGAAAKSMSVGATEVQNESYLVDGAGNTLDDGGGNITHSIS